MEYKNGPKTACISLHTPISIAKCIHSYLGLSTTKKYSHSRIWRIHPIHKSRQHLWKRLLSNRQTKLPARSIGQQPFWTCHNWLQPRSHCLDWQKQSCIQQQIRQNRNTTSSSELECIRYINQADWRSSTHTAFRAPQALLDPTYRPTEKNLQTQQPATKASGFATNHAYLDGKGWNPDRILKGDNHRSEYRDRFNADHPFHRNVHASKAPQLPHKEYNYRFNWNDSALIKSKTTLQ